MSDDRPDPVELRKRLASCNARVVRALRTEQRARKRHQEAQDELRQARATLRAVLDTIALPPLDQGELPATESSS